jgi:hypothetical protein
MSKKMEMTNAEILKSYNEAKNKTSQVGVLAELNCCSKKKIIEILVKGGIDPAVFEKAADKPKVKKNKENPDEEAIIREALLGMWDRLSDEYNTLKVEWKKISSEYERKLSLLVGLIDGKEKENN